LLIELIEIWGECGITKSLNDIFSGEMETIEPITTTAGTIENGRLVVKRFKDENAQNLFNLLEELFGEEILSERE